MDEQSFIPINETSMVYKPRLMQSLLKSHHFLQSDDKVCMFWFDCSRVKRTEDLRKSLTYCMLGAYGGNTDPKKETIYSTILKFIKNIIDIEEYRSGFGVVAFRHKKEVRCVDISKYFCFKKHRICFVDLCKIFPDFQVCSEPQLIIECALIYLHGLEDDTDSE